MTILLWVWYQCNGPMGHIYNDNGPSGHIYMYKGNGTYEVIYTMAMDLRVIYTMAMDLRVIYIMTMDLRVIYICTKAMGPMRSYIQWQWDLRGHIYNGNGPSGHIQWNPGQIPDLICHRIINWTDRHMHMDWNLFIYLMFIYMCGFRILVSKSNNDGFYNYSIWMVEWLIYKFFILICIGLL